MIGSIWSFIYSDYLSMIGEAGLGSSTTDSSFCRIIGSEEVTNLTLGLDQSSSFSRAAYPLSIEALTAPILISMIILLSSRSSI